MKRVHCKKDHNWLETCLEQINTNGFATVEGVLEPSFLKTTREKMYDVQEKILKEVGADKLDAANEVDVVRLMMKLDPFCIRYLEIPEMLALIDQTVSNTAVMHLQNGFILPSFPTEKTPDTFQYNFHWDFPRHMK